MKRLSLLLLIGITVLFSACGYDKYNVRLSNGTIVKVMDTEDREYHSGDTVCINRVSLGNWTIDVSGNMLDTTFRRQLRDSSVYYSDYRIGVIQK